ncbi:DUF5330 domain-containing protein [Paenochrobactrum sp. BZR 588]|uniref:DUF5330 domain-containing protein n=1 Tax=unclassified Paenochrobactrum TaxID=2639760 RepID=UPI003853AD19
MIRFIIKSVFWLSLAFIVMPKIINTDTDQTQRQDAAIVLPPKEKIDGLIAAGQTAAEVGGFCYSNPQLCIDGKNMLSAAGSGLLNGSSKLLDFLSDQFGSETTQDKTPHTDTEHSAPTAPDHQVPLPRYRP